MNKFEFLLKKFSVKILNIEIFTFSFFIILTIVYNFCNDSHLYFNDSDFPLSFDGILAFIVTMIFGFFFFLAILFPFLFLVQVLFIIKFKLLNKAKISLLLIVILYFGVLVSLFSIYSIKQHQNIVTKKIV